MVAEPRALSTGVLGRIALPVVAVAAIAAQAELRLPITVPGHRGLVWLTVLVAVALIARPRGIATAVGAASTLLAIGMGTDPLMAIRYVAAAVLLDAALSLPAVTRWPALMILIAGPVHLVALASPAIRGLPFGDRALTHLAFGVAAGLLGWGIARFARRITPAQPVGGGT